MSEFIIPAVCGFFCLMSYFTGVMVGYFVGAVNGSRANQ